MKTTPDIQDLQWDTLWTNVHLVTMEKKSEGYREISNGAIATKDGKIAWLGSHSSLPKGYHAKAKYDGQGYWLTPGLIDCHTHIVYAGNRSSEFEARLKGAKYDEIARQGGGILATVSATRAATEDELLVQSLNRIKYLLAEGVTTLEIKSGYGLDLITEANILRVARKIGAHYPIRTTTTYLGAHAVPKEYSGKENAYIDSICNITMAVLSAEGLIDAVDVYCEKIGFTIEQTERVFEAAQRFNLPVKLHAEQLSDQGGAALAAKYGALSVDHLEYLSEEGVKAIAISGTVAVLLPGAFYCVRERQLPPIKLLRQAGVPIAVATDCNPGTSPLTSILLAMNMACTLFRLSPQEALAGTTINAAKALGLESSRGSLAVGKLADFALWAIDQPVDLVYAMGANPCRYVVNGGVPRKAIDYFMPE